MSDARGFRLRAKKAGQTIKEHPEATAAGALAVGVAGRPYYRVARAANNARVLGKPGRMKGLVETLEHHQGAEPGMHFGDAKGAFAQVGAQQRAYQRAVKANKDVRRMNPTADRWANTFRGAKEIKSAQPGKKVRPHEVVLRPRKVEDRIHRRILDRAVDQAPKNKQTLYRGQVKGKKFDGSPTSFTTEESFARRFGESKEANARLVEMQLKGVGVPKKLRSKYLTSQGLDHASVHGEHQTVRLKPGSAKAVNISGANKRVRQREWIAKPVSKSLPRSIYHAGKNRRVVKYDPVTKQIHLDGGYVVSRGGQRVPKEARPEPEQLTMFNPEKHRIVKRKTPLTDQQLSRRKRIQAHISQAGSTAGLTSLGLLGASVVAGRKGKAVAHKLRAASVNTGIVGAGIGGVGGFNFARIQSEEARKREMPKQPKKVTLVKRAYDPERNRQNRQKAYASGLAVASGGAAGAAGAHATMGGYRLVQARSEGNQARLATGGAWESKAQSDKHLADAARETKAKKSGSAARARGARVQAYNWREGAKSEVKVARGHLANKKIRLAQAKGSGKKAAVALGASAALGAGSYAVERHRRRGGASYNGWWEHRY